MDKDAVRDLLIRYRAGRCTDAERELVDGWLMHGSGDPLDLNDLQLLDDLQEIRLRLQRDLGWNMTSDPVATKLSTLRKWLPYAAAVLLFLVSVLFYHPWFDSAVSKREDEIIGFTSTDAEPGGNRATLQLADGSAIALSEAQSGIVVGERITYADGTAVAAGDRSDAGRYVLSTPNGGTYQVVLPDGSKVWLNAASTLRYPSAFNKSQRIVELDGEAYFEVQKQRSPFIVKTRSQEVEVLGTVFNINAYANETAVKTTLVEGGVRIAAAANSAQTVVLKPGQQSTVQQGRFSVSEVDPAAFTAWRDGYFVFNGTELKDAMKQLSRWYNVEVVYEGDIPLTPFYGRISRSDSLSQVLGILKEGTVNFRIVHAGDKKKLIVMP